MAERIANLVESEQAAVEELKQRLSTIGRAPTFLLAGPVEARLDLVLETFTGSVSGRFLDFGTPQILKDLTNGPPLYGRDLVGRLSDTVLRRFLLRKVGEMGDQVIGAHVPAVIWKIMSETDVDGPKRLLTGLQEWASPCLLVLSYPLGADPSSLSIEELSSSLAKHLIELRLTAAERRYLENHTEVTRHVQQ